MAVSALCGNNTLVLVVLSPESIFLKNICILKLM